MSEERRIVGESIRPPDASTRCERPKDNAESGPVVINIGLGPVTNPPAKPDAAGPGPSERER